jgi:hypothetical protein
MQMLELAVVQEHIRNSQEDLIIEYSQVSGKMNQNKITMPKHKNKQNTQETNGTLLEV